MSASRLSDQALVTEADVKAYLDVPTDATSPSVRWIRRAVNGVSAVIVEKTGRDWRGLADDAQDAQQPRIFEHDSSRVLEIDPARSPSLVRVTGTPKDSDSWVALDDGDWIAEPQRAAIKQRIRFLGATPLPARQSGWSALSRHLSGSPGTRWPAEVASEDLHSSVEVTAIWGYASVPDQVKLAALLWISQLYKRDVQFLSDSIPEGQRIAGGIPKDVLDILEGDSDDASSVAAV